MNFKLNQTSQMKAIVNRYHNKTKGAVICGSLLTSMTKEELQSVIVMLSEQQTAMIRQHKSELMIMQNQQQETAN